MTRINANIKPKDLIDQHLLAEYREMVRIPNAYHKNPANVIKAIKKASPTFKLGKGHVIYFYDKLKYLHDRFIEIKNELNHRQIENNMTDDMFNNLPAELYNDISDTDLKLAGTLVSQRICSNMSTMKGHPRYYKTPIDKDTYCTALLEKYK